MKDTVTRYYIPIIQPVIISWFGLLGIPSNLFVIALTFDKTSWRAGIEATGFSEVLFYWAVISLVINGFMIYSGFKLLKNTQIIKKCIKCKQEQCICAD